MMSFIHFVSKAADVKDACHSLTQPQTHTQEEKGVKRQTDGLKEKNRESNSPFSIWFL